MIPGDASRDQVRAANPRTSTWLSANAGSGKTRVLTDRVARLLLEGAPPQRILCLTYTKAAASEMQNRLFQRLGKWAMLGDADLRDELATLGVEDADNTTEKRQAARTLFARAIETPGGLKIQTIHSFCASLLRRFPLEAQVSPSFSEMDQRAAEKLKDTVLEDIATSPDRHCLETFLSTIGETQLDTALSAFIGNRVLFGRRVSSAELAKTFGIPEGIGPEGVAAEVLNSAAISLLKSLISPLRAGSDKEGEKAGKIEEALDLPTSSEQFQKLLPIFVTQSGKTENQPKIDAFPNKSTREKLGESLHDLNALMQAFADAKDRYLAACAAANTRALLDLAQAFVPRYTAAKSQRAWLDFDDQIQLARDLLTDPDVAQWVLFRLDGGIDHILVDEAQDTSPLQWEVIRLLAQEFTTGRSARSDAERTLFVVGDPKQSIYSFQGADPAGFDQMRAYFDTALSQVEQPFQSRQLRYSFRSASPILRLVDDTFHTIDQAGLGETSAHIPVHSTMPGRVDLWPALSGADPATERPWTDTLDHPAEDDPKLVLARKVAGEMKRLLESGAQLTRADGQPRPITPKDFLVLVQRRSEIFHEIIRACKELGLPIAGADRLRVGGELAVKDLLAVLSFAATPEDSLSLAAALRSPLFGWSEAELYALAQPRQSPYLWVALRDNAGAHSETYEVLRDIRDQADFLRPYELLERLLTRHGGRRKLLARLGPEAEDGIDALLTQALQYEALEVPSLTGFLGWFGGIEEDLKRQLDGTRDEIRVMTVHGAKGLEAPIVFLPDCAVRGTPRMAVFAEIDGVPVWRESKPNAPQKLRTAIDNQKGKADEERLRLLYVAMTRAENWLIVAAAGKTGTSTESWHSAVSQGMEHHGASLPFEAPTGTGMRVQVGDWPEDTRQPFRIGSETKEDLPAFAGQPAIVPPHPPEPRAPSDLGGAKILFGDSADALSGEAAKLRGTHLHKLLEQLPEIPEAQRAGEAERILGPDIPDRALLIDEALSVLNAPELSFVFEENALAEVEITAPVSALNGAPILGAIDRLVLTPDTVLAVDFKSNALVPDRPEQTPEGLLRQMGAYADALGQIYPDRTIETAILWTRTASLMRLPHDLVIAALRRAGTA